MKADDDPFEVLSPKELAKRNSPMNDKSKRLALRPDSFDAFKTPDTKDKLFAHLEELTECIRQLHTKESKAVKAGKPKAKMKSNPWDGDNPLTYVVELIHDDDTETLPAKLVVDDYEAVTAGKKIYQTLNKHKTKKKALTDSERLLFETRGFWPRSLAHAALLSTDEIWEKNKDKIKPSLAKDLKSLHYAILLTASLNRNFESIDDWKTQLAEAKKTRLQGNKNGGGKSKKPSDID